MTPSVATGRLALVIWSAIWLPGLLLFAYRTAMHVRAERVGRAFFEGLAIMALPMAAYGAYVWAETAVQLQARRDVSLLGAAASVAQVGIPFALCAAFSWLRERRAVAGSTRRAWWLAAVVGAAGIPLLTPGLFMTQLMVLFGG